MKDFWGRFPGVYFALSILCGVAFYYRFFYLLPIGCLGKNRTHKIGFYLIAFLSYLNTHVSSLPETPETICHGKGYLTFHKVQKCYGRKGPFIKMQGRLNFFSTKTKEFHFLPCMSTFDLDQKRPIAHCDYITSGTLYPLSYSYRLKMKKWTPVAHTFSLAEKRFQLKEWVRSYIRRSTNDLLTQDFLIALATGEIDSPLLRFLFQRSGISHTLAISGFHYAWLIATLLALISLFTTGRLAPILLFIVLTAYFFFIGASPSLNRAWVAASIYCLGLAIDRKASGLNSLGLGAAISLMIDPLALFSVGYQLSYLATFAILTIYPSIDQLAQKWIPNLNQRNLRKLSIPSSIIARIAICLRHLFTLTIAATGSTLIISLYHFESFPLTGIFYNLFFPLAITLSLLGIFLTPLPLIGPLILRLDAAYSRHLLEILYWNGGRGHLWFCSISKEMTLSFICMLIFGGFYLEHRRYLLTRKKCAV